MVFWKAESEKEIEIIRAEFEERLTLERCRHLGEETRIKDELHSIQKKFSAHKDNIIRVQNVSNALISVASELKMSVAGAFQRASTAIQEVDMIVLADRKLINKHGEVE
jgi:hypothetical protein